MNRELKNVLNFIMIAILNVLLFILLQIASQFVHFFIYGEGVSSDKYTLRVSTFFALLQLMIVLLLFYKKTIIKTYIQLILSVVLIIGLYIYYLL